MQRDRGQDPLICVRKINAPAARFKVSAHLHDPANTDSLREIERGHRLELIDAVLKIKVCVVVIHPNVE